jgi:hypothetical protein
MERISALIEKLRDQFAAGADIEQVLLTTQLLEGELRYHLQKGTVPSSPHVAVVLPANAHRPSPGKMFNPEHERFQPAPAPVHQPMRPAPLAAPAPVAAAAPAMVTTPAMPVGTQAAKAPPYPPSSQPIWPDEAPQPTPRPAPARQPEPENGKYNPIREVPTLTHQIPQEARRELNEVIAVQTARSLNDAWKEQQKEQPKEVSKKLTEAPIRDLRKAVGINDRFLFISELFRGDETMYERSIKTINNFSIFQEAYYWMERELKLKLAWDMEKHSTQLFYQLVKRRFS